MLLCLSDEFHTCVWSYEKLLPLGIRRRTISPVASFPHCPIPLYSYQGSTILLKWWVCLCCWGICSIHHSCLAWFILTQTSLGNSLLSQVLFHEKGCYCFTYDKGWEQSKFGTIISFSNTLWQSCYLQSFPPLRAVILIVSTSICAQHSKNVAVRYIKNT